MVITPSSANELARLREALTPLDFAKVATDSSATLAYFELYGLDPVGHEHVFGTFRAGSHALAAHAFIPPEPRGTVLVMHGFFDHTGTLSAAIRHLLDRGFAVAAYDQPGHGLSSGPRATIGDFGEYATVLDEFLRLCRVHLPPPYHALAHSTGAAILLTRLLTHDDEDIGHVVLVAPLVHSAQWYLSTRGGQFLQLFVDDVPRVFRKNTGDEQFLDFVRKDPLQPRRASLEWLNELVEWNERIESYAPSERPVTVIQGDADTVVDWQYNLAFIRSKFPNARVEMIEGGRHQLLGEAKALRARVFRIVDQALDGRLEP
jgi:lysophospholipase